MKKLVLLASVFSFSCFTFSALAQVKKPASKMPMQKSVMGGPTSKGKWLLGASAGLFSQKEDNAGTIDKISSYSILPGVSYFIEDDLALGLMLGLGGSKLTSAGVAEDQSSMMLVAPTARYYVPIADRFKFYGNLSVPIGSRHTTLSAGNDVDVKMQVFGVEVRPGFAFFPSKKISVDLNFGSIYFLSEKVNDFKTTTIGVNLLGNDLAVDPDFLAFTGPQLGLKFHLGN